MLKIARRFAAQPTLFELDSQIDRLLPSDFVTENVPIEAIIKMFYIKELNEPIQHEWQKSQHEWVADGIIKERLSLLDHLIQLNKNIKSNENLEELYNRYISPFLLTHKNDQYILNEETELPIDRFGRIYGYGSRKTAKANVWLVHNPKVESLYPVLINNRPLHDYFENASDRQSILMPLEIANQHWDTANRGLKSDPYGTFKIFATTSGGGISGQANSIRMGIARALAKWHSSLVPYFQECIFSHLFR